MKEKLEDDLREIKDIMNRSTRFTSLSGLSGVAAGVAGLAGAFVAHSTVFSEPVYFTFEPVPMGSGHSKLLFAIAAATLLLAAVGAVVFTRLKAKGHTVWNTQAKRFVANMAIPMLAGGLVCGLLWLHHLPGLLLPLSLVFYGLALVNAGRDTLPEIRVLGLVETGLGIGALLFIPYSLLFWAVGFGGMHVVFGVWVQWKHKP